MATAVAAAHPNRPPPPVTALARARTDISVIPTSTGKPGPGRTAEVCFASKTRARHLSARSPGPGGAAPQPFVVAPPRAAEAAPPPHRRHQTPFRHPLRVKAPSCLAPRQATSWRCTDPWSWTNAWSRWRRPSASTMVGGGGGVGGGQYSHARAALLPRVQHRRAHQLPALPPAAARARPRRVFANAACAPAPSLPTLPGPALPRFQTSSRGTRTEAASSAPSCPCRSYHTQVRGATGHVHCAGKLSVQALF